jgi:hypothetical protein
MRGDAGTDPADTLRFFKQERKHLRDRAAWAARQWRKHKLSSARAKESYVKDFYNTEAHIQETYYKAWATAASGLFWAIRRASTEMQYTQRKEDTLNKLRAMA